LNPLTSDFESRLTDYPELRQFASSVWVSFSPNYTNLHQEEAAQLKRPSKDFLLLIIGLHTSTTK